tara:strand:- start:910 stop:1131 length:222 start_codon:yes stop_codon:yes gene_type:complete
MGVRRRRKGKPTVTIASFDAKMLKEIEMHMRDADRQENAQSRYLQRHHRARAASPSLSETVSAAVQQMRIEDG